MPTPLISSPSAFTYQTIHPHILRQCQELYFRQSFLNDILICPMMGMYRYVLGLEETRPFFAALLGTAGHDVIYHIHKNKKFNHTGIELMEMFEQAFRTELHKAPTLPSIRKQFDGIDSQLADALPLYTELLRNYQAHKRNQSFLATMHEQSFVLIIPDLSDPSNPSSPFIFTGQIDQAGFYDDGTFSMRDIKFRDNTFRPSRTELDLNLQLTIYSAAIAYGQPACFQCKPTYTLVPASSPGSAPVQQLTYHGPCDSCTRLIGTAAWPSTPSNPKFVERCEVVWMRDFAIHAKDQYEKIIIDNKSPKIPNPKGKGPPIFPRRYNPDYHSGYKVGDLKGPCFLTTYRTQASIQILMADILALCKNLREGQFHRKPGSHCNFWCKYVEQCKSGIELQVKEANMANVVTFGTEDPF